MSQDKWTVRVAGSLTVSSAPKTKFENVAFHSKLSTVLAVTNGNQIHVYDVSSGNLLQKTHFPPANRNGKVECSYLEIADKLLVTDGRAVGLRRDHQGVLLLDTILQTPVLKSDQIVRVELLLQEATQLQQCLDMLELVGSEFTNEVKQELEEKIQQAQNITPSSLHPLATAAHKGVKWSTVCLELPHHSLRTVCTSIMSELRRLDRYVSALSIASGLNERLGALVPSPVTTSPSETLVEKMHMFSEAARRDTFKNWPHMNYRWALPDQMAEAGFYHQPNNQGDDRAMCFTCNVCLVCWEPTDEPWSEHERHSPTCPFVKGEFTQNVPLSITQATSPAHPHGEEVRVIANSHCSERTATATGSSTIIIWNTQRNLTKEATLFVDPGEPLIVDKHFPVPAGYSDIRSRPYPKEAWMSEGSKTAQTSHSAEDDLIFELPLGGEQNVNFAPDELLIPPRPSQDVLVTALAICGFTETPAPDGEGVHQGYKPINPPGGVFKGSAQTQGSKRVSQRFECLVVGASIRKATDLKPADVQTLNDVNEASSRDLQVLDIMKVQNENFDEGIPCSSCDVFVPYLLIYNLHLASKSTPVLDPAEPKYMGIHGTKKASGKGTGTNVGVLQDNSVISCSSEILFDFCEDPSADELVGYLGMDVQPVSSSESKFSGPGSSSDNGSQSSSQGSQEAVGVVKKDSQPLEATRQTPELIAIVKMPESLQAVPNLRVTENIPTIDGRHLIVYLSVPAPKEETDSKSILGALALYSLRRVGACLVVDEEPVVVRLIHQWASLPRNLALMPLELLEESEMEQSSVGARREGLVAMLCNDNTVEIIDLRTMSTLTSTVINTSESLLYLFYCNSMDRLCVFSEKGVIFYLQFSKGDEEIEDPTPGTSTSRLRRLAVHSKPQPSGSMVEEGGHLDISRLRALHTFTEFENLTPVFTCAAPPCWSEMMQAQKQRKHPQHLQQPHGDDQHTRSYRLHSDPGTAEEHIFELSLQRSLYVGHIDLKFSLHPICLVAPRIQVTLLTYQLPAPGAAKSTSVDAPIHFNPLPSRGGNGMNPVTSSEFLASHSAEIVCGPLEICSYLDVSKQAGVVTLTAPSLFSSKHKTFLIHLYAPPLDKQDEATSEYMMSSGLLLGGSRDSPVSTPQQPGSTLERLVTHLPGSKRVEPLKGCNWLQEISITVRRPSYIFLPTLPNFRVEREKMLVDTPFHIQLVEMASSASEEKQQLALDILLWVAGILLPPRCAQTLVKSIKSNMSQFVYRSYIRAGRSIARKATKLLLLCLEHGEEDEEKSNNQDFEHTLLSVLLEWLPEVVKCESSGALHWYMVLIGHVKGLEPAATATSSLGLLRVVAAQLRARTHPLHSLLTARFGLSGLPCDSELFECELPHLPQSCSSPVTYASVTGGTIAGMTNNHTAHCVPHFHSEADIKDLLVQGGSSGHGRQEVKPCHLLKGLLEVEPLQFTCHAASDGTKLETIDTGLNGVWVNSKSIHVAPYAADNVALWSSATSLPPVIATDAAALEKAIWEISKKKHELEHLIKKKPEFHQEALLLEKVKECIKNATQLSHAYKHNLPDVPWEQDIPLSQLEELLKAHIGNVKTSLESPGSPTEKDDPNPLHDKENNIPIPMDIEPDLSETVEEFKPDAAETTATFETEDSKKDGSAKLARLQRLLHPAPLAGMVLERLHGGARRWVILDFGQVVTLTDLLLPACPELACLSLDVWTEREDLDSQRLVVATDIANKALVLSDLQPPPNCRFLKVTIIGRYGMSATSCKIPLGMFYGHSVLVDSWPQESAQTQLTVLQSLHEDVLCRYNLSVCRLKSLLVPLLHSSGIHRNLAHMAHFINSSSHSNHSKDPMPDEDQKIHATYQECIVLQQQLNIIQSVWKRVEHSVKGSTDSQDTEACTDKLRSISHSLLTLLLGIPCSNYSASLDREACESLFWDVCVGGTAKAQLCVGTLVMRACAHHPWWGEFLVQTLLKLCSSDHLLPLHRLFTLICYMGGKSVTAGVGVCVVESALASLRELLKPLDTCLPGQSLAATLDLPLLSWLLLYLSHCLNQLGDSSAGRWEFLMGEAVLNKKGGSRKSNAEGGHGSCHKLPKRLQHHKKYLEELESLKDSLVPKIQAMSNNIISPSGSNTEKTEGGSSSAKSNNVMFTTMKVKFSNIVKQEEISFQKRLKDITSKHVKDIIRIRRLELGKGRSSRLLENGSSEGEDEDSESKTDVVLKRSECIAVSKSMAQLLLRMDYSCRVDSFLLACKVLAGICLSCKCPITLWELMNPNELKQFLSLAVHAPRQLPDWGGAGPWVNHAIRALITDLLQGERLYETSANAVDEEVANLSTMNLMPDTDDVVLASQIEDPMDTTDAAAAPDTKVMELVKPPMFIETYESDVDDFPDQMEEALNAHYNKTINNPLHSMLSKDINYVYTPSARNIPRMRKDTLGDLFAPGSSPSLGPPSSVSAAIDCRLETRVDLVADLRARSLAQQDVHTLQLAINAPLKIAVEGATAVDRSNEGSPHLEASSLDMLRLCFDTMFRQLYSGADGQAVEALLQLWLALTESGRTGFDSNTTPAITLSPQAISALLSALLWCPSVCLKTWCLAFRVLTLLSNLRSAEAGADLGAAAWRLDNPPDVIEHSTQGWLAQDIVADPNLVGVLARFLAMPCPNRKVGSSVVTALHDFLVRLQTRCDVTTPASRSGIQLKELLLKLAAGMTSPGGPIHRRSGPLDAQCELLDQMTIMHYDNIQLSTIMNLVEPAGAVVQQYLMQREGIGSGGEGDGSGGSAHCFGGLFAAMITHESRPSNAVAANQDTLTTSLLRLLNKLMYTPIASQTQLRLARERHLNDDQRLMESPLTDSSKLEQQQQQQQYHAPPPGIELSQTDEHKASHASGSNNSGSTCSHAGTRVPCVADTVLRHGPTMQALMVSLAWCNGSTMAMLLGPGAIGNGVEHGISVADALFQLLCTLNHLSTSVSLALKPLLNYMQGGVTGFLSSVGSPCQLSEPLLWFILRVLDCPRALREFTALGGIQIICNQLVGSHTSLLNPRPSFVSTVMQHLIRGSSHCCHHRTKPDQQSSRKQLPPRETVPTPDGLINCAPLGSVWVSSPAAQPAEVLLQPSAQHRRARTPAWSYHFYPEEAWVEIVIRLPCALLLRQVHLQPHYMSLATCPSAVALELGVDGDMCGISPLGSPTPTSGLTTIQLTLPRPHVADTILIRLYRPRDSSNIGLSQIKLLASTAFGEAVAKSLAASSDLPSENLLTKSSVGWVRLLSHCLAVFEGNVEGPCPVSRALAAESRLAVVGVSLLLDPHAPLGPYRTQLEKVLLSIGLFSHASGLQLLDSLFSNAHTLNRADGSNSESLDSAVEVVFRLCVGPGVDSQWVSSRVQFLLMAVGNIAQDSGDIPPHLIQCVATILWHAHSYFASANLPAVISVELVKNVWGWCRTLRRSSALKRALDCLLCSLCHVKPSHYELLLQWMGILLPPSNSNAQEAEMAASVTDDLKGEGTPGRPGPLAEDCLNTLTENTLETLGVVSQSPSASRQLLATEFPHMLANALLDFCLTRLDDVPPEGLTDYNKAGSKQRRANLDWHKIAALLRLFSELCREETMKEWLGNAEGSTFWLPLLKLLCQSAETYAGVEDAVVSFLEAACRGHQENQQLLAATLCQLICSRTPDSPGNSKTLWFLHGVPGLVRRLLLQLLLESEKVEVCVRSEGAIGWGPRINHTIMGVSAIPLPHPHFPVGHPARVFSLPLHTTMVEILRHAADSSWMLSSGIPGNQSSNNNGENDPPLDPKDFVEHIAVEIKDKYMLASENPAPPPGPALKKRKSAPPSQDKPSTSGASSVAAFLPRLVVIHKSIGNSPLPSQLTLSQLMSHLKTSGSVTLTLVHKKRELEKENSSDINEESLLNTPEQPSILLTFAKLGGLALLAQRLPLLYPHVYRQGGCSSSRGEKSGGVDLGFDSEWVKIEEVVEDLYFEEMSGEIFGNETNSGSCNHGSSAGGCVPPHSLASFALFLRLPGYAEYLLRDRRKATCILRLALGVTDPPDTSEAALAVLPFQTLQGLLESTPLGTDDGVVLRRATLEGGALHLVLACLAILSHQLLPDSLPAMPPEMMLVASKVATMFGVGGTTTEHPKKGDEKAPQYWAKGTGFGTGSTAQSWDVEGAIWRQRTEEEHVTWLIRVLASYINPQGEIPPELLSDVEKEEADDTEEKKLLPLQLHDLLSHSCLLNTISSYLRNDSVLDMARHVPLYRAVLQLLRSLAVSHQLVDLLLPSTDPTSAPSTLHLLMQMKGCVDIYASRLRSKSNKTGQGQSPPKEEEHDEGLAQLIPDIQQTASVLQLATSRLIEQQRLHSEKEDPEKGSGSLSRHSLTSKQQLYCDIMKKLQFDTWEMIVEEEGGGYRFAISHHFEGQVRGAGDRCNPGRAKRLAQETVTLSTALPLSYSSSVFVRCDQDRLDIMKVLITGPDDTPYANGCFEFDVYFPPDYPSSPMMINHETTGHHTVRFNPNLYNDGKVCLSILNTWHGRPEEKWNPQTSSLLQVLVSIQSLVLVPEPYFNEPGYERSRGTPAGSLSCREYASNIRQAAVRWAMLEQLRKPCPAFKEVIQKHFWLKRAEIERQIESWISEQDACSTDRRAARTISINNQALRRHYAQLKEELSNLKCPEGLEEIAWEEESRASTSGSEAVASIDTLLI